MNYKLTKYMDFQNPTEKFSGKRESVQGFAVFGNTGFMLFHTGICAAFDLKSRDPDPIDVFKLGSYNIGVSPDGRDDKRYANHANDAMFSTEFYADDDEFPLLYVTSGNSGDSDADGYIGRCAVERITFKNGRFHAECVQTVSFDTAGEYRKGIERPAWGWPATLLDSKRKEMWLFSARYRTTKAFADKYDENTFIFTRFALPNVYENKVVLRPCDILEQFTLPYDVFFTQGGTVIDRKIYYLFGAGREEYPDTLRVFSLDGHNVVGKYDLSGSILGNEEVECCAPYDGALLINTGSKRLYRFEAE